MKILAIEASSEQGSVALLVDGAILSRRIDGAANHSESVLRDIAALLNEAGLTAGQLDAVAFGAGPGAFTGLRLACGVAQGLALGAGRGVATVGSLDALALQASAPRVFVATDARMGEVYHAAYVRDEDGTPRPVSAPRCDAPENIELLEGHWTAIGSAFAVWPDALRHRLAMLIDDCRDDLVARADEVAVLGARMALSSRLLPPEQAAPLYVRDKVALTTAERLARGGRA
jgi:tRNA threonylcarbamoyladenosine biosynthesis protein TsaB